MSQFRFKTLALTLLTATTLAAGAQAAVVGESSDYNVVNVGPSVISSPGGTHTPGRPGIGVLATGLSSTVDFQGLRTFSPADGNGVTNLDYPSTTPTDHSSLGVFNFARTSSQDVWFGEFKQSSNIADGTHSVYYVGEDGNNSALPAVGTATYAVKGINDYAGKGILTGTFTANITSGSTGTLSGGLSGGGRVVAIGTANITGTSFSGSGGSYADGTVLFTGGSVSGQFFGNSGQSLAGIVTFSNRVYDTAFGGDKQ